MFNEMKNWCNAHGFKWKIINNCFFWQTNYQTGKLDQNGKISWYKQTYFNMI